MLNRFLLYNTVFDVSYSELKHLLGPNSLVSDIAFWAFLYLVAFDHYEVSWLLLRSRRVLICWFYWLRLLGRKIECVGDRDLAARKALCGIPLVRFFGIVVFVVLIGVRRHVMVVLLRAAELLSAIRLSLLLYEVVFAVIAVPVFVRRAQKFVIRRSLIKLVIK